MSPRVAAKGIGVVAVTRLCVVVVAVVSDWGAVPPAVPKVVSLTAAILAVVCVSPFKDDSVQEDWVTEETPDELVTVAVDCDDVEEDKKRTKDTTIQWIVCGCLCGNIFG